MTCSLGISNVLEEISSPSHSIVFLYFFGLIAEEGVLLSPCYFFELCMKWKYLSFSPLPFTSLPFTAICKASSDSHFAFLHFFFLGMVLITASCTMSPTSVHNSSGSLSLRSNPLNLFVLRPPFITTGFCHCVQAHFHCPVHGCTHAQLLTHV
ncbi:unnamed protein product [Rangifer tarandus platyrhynchus]|uniref:Uncharacterized protein n=2 Tax=Rangifer tarandus platyrhynchus TaxID=3082113 RepID=A0AC59ZCP3_RANTA|nr:unnamed protein product [Rangifer tarandus platyrhynchus]